MSSVPVTSLLLYQGQGLFQALSVSRFLFLPKSGKVPEDNSRSIINSCEMNELGKDKQEKIKELGEYPYQDYFSLAKGNFESQPKVVE